MEIIIIESDKGKSFTMSSMESYLRQGNLHTSVDKEVDMDKVKKRHRDV